MKKNIVRLNETQLRKMIAESVKKVLKEEYGDHNWFMNHESYPPETLNSRDDEYQNSSKSLDEEAEEFFNDYVEGEELESNEVEIDVQDEETGKINVYVTKEGWQFCFRAYGHCVDETDLYCKLSRGGRPDQPASWNEIEYVSPDGEAGSFPVSQFVQSVLIKNYFPYSNVTADVDDV
jgi:hypothetical protein